MNNERVIQELNFIYGQLMLAIWNPDLMNFIHSKRRRNSRRLFYKAIGIVLHDRALNAKADA